MKRCYFVYEKGEPFGGFAYVASSAREARKIGWARAPWSTGQFTDIRAIWERGVDVTDKPIGYEIKLEEGIRMGIFTGEEL